MHSHASTVEGYLESLPSERCEALSAVRSVILANLDPQYEEGMQYGMIGYYVPHRVYPKGYHCDPKQPLPFAGLASQKNYMSLYMMSVYCGCTGPGAANRHAEWFREAWSKSGKKLNMGKACIRFKKIDDLALDVIGDAVRRVPASMYIQFCEANIAGTGKQRSGKAGS